MPSSTQADPWVGSTIAFVEESDGVSRATVDFRTTDYLPVLSFSLEESNPVSGRVLVVHDIMNGAVRIAAGKISVSASASCKSCYDAGYEQGQFDCEPDTTGMVTSDPHVSGFNKQRCASHALMGVLAVGLGERSGSTCSIS